MAFRQLAAIVESSEDAIIGKSLDGAILTWNRGAERMYGYSTDEVIGRPISMLVPPSRPDELPRLITRIERGEDIEPIETTRTRKDGSEIEVSLKISAIRDVDGQIVGASTIARDITQAKARAALERDLAERRALLAHLVAAGEEERRRIAEDIHDDSIQAITAAGMRLQILRRTLEDPKQLGLLDELEQTIQLSISRLRHLLFELRPPVLDNEGLSAALEMYLAELEGQTGIDYRFEDSLRSQPSEDIRVILYRIAQEALTNARKHAQATRVTVSLEESEGGYVVRVADDGVGFSPGTVQPTPGHLGLASMRERATLAGGWLRIDTAPGRGTTIELWLPALAGRRQAPDAPSADGGQSLDLKAL
jgi:PAS domain S-box-containing protein